LFEDYRPKIGNTAAERIETEDTVELVPQSSI